MVASTRATASMANRRRALATIFDSAAARHANTPATPPAAQPAANSAGAAFLASVRTLQREHFDMKDGLCAADGICHGGHWFCTPFPALDNATLPVRVEANALLFSALELMVDPTSPAADWMDSSHSNFPSDGKRVLLEFARRMIPAGDPFQGQADMLSIRISAGVDPHDKIGDFNAALKAARTRATLQDEDVKALFIKSLDTVFYQPVVSRLLLHDQRAARHDLLTIGTHTLWYSSLGTSTLPPVFIHARHNSSSCMSGYFSRSDSWWVTLATMATILVVSGSLGSLMSFSFTIGAHSGAELTSTGLSPGPEKAWR
ncbi:hypothetical protein CYMTET_46980 [Cymbomonas tetramitiformis]|uniref:Uncharacterized protein n=1 Tax=Cymbomonas tetramitiformis TaxID=36881 RepID=A0AAE0BWX0_9CHLO|nr:hypothetical protein CYMTET_46980 [Cymbomonas tetramitiformis]